MNNIMKIYLIAILAILIIDPAICQVSVDNKDSNWIRYTSLSAQSKRIYDHKLYQGDVYLYDGWKAAEFILPDESKVFVDSVKLNLLRGHVEINLRGKHLQLRGSQFNSFMFSDVQPIATFKSKHYYFDKGDRLPGIIKTINVGDHTVLVSYKAEVRNVSKENPLMLEKLKKDIVRVTKLRYIEKDGALTRIKSKKDLHKFFGSKKDIKQFISKNKLSHKEEDDIAEVLVFATNG